MIRCYIRTNHKIPSWSLHTMIFLAKKLVMLKSQINVAFICIEKICIKINIYIFYIYTIMHKDVYLHTPMTWTFQFHRSHTRFASPALWRLQSWSTPVWTRYKVGPYHYKAHVAIHWWPSCLWEFCHVFVICMFVWWLEVVIFFLDGVITPHYPSYMAKYRGYNPIDAW